MVRYFYLSLFFLFSFLLSSWATTGTSLIEKLQNSVVLLETTIDFGAYATPGTRSGSGFVVNPKLGIIVTNRHLAPAGAAAHYWVTFHDGTKIEAYFLYADPWQDFAFLKVDPHDLPKTASALPLSAKPLQLNDKVLICSKNQGYPFSVQTGIVTDLYMQQGHFPNRTIQISMNVFGGSSGAPIVLKKDGSVVVLQYGQRSSSAAGLPIAYVQDALVYLQKEQTPPRYHPGHLPGLYLLDDLAQFADFPKHLMEEYRRQFPEARSRILIIESIIPGSPAEGVLEEGDALWAIGDQKIGPDLYALDKIFNEHGPKPLDITIIRRGEMKTVTLVPEDLEHQRIQKIIFFAGGYFYEPDDYVRKNFDVSAPRGKPGVFISSAQSNSPFRALLDSSLIFREERNDFFEIMALDGKPVHDLETFIRIIPDLVKKKNFFVTYVNHCATDTYDDKPLPTRRKFIEGIRYSKTFPAPAVAVYEPKTWTWELEKIPFPEEAKTS